MPLIPEGIIDEIQARADIAELIGRYVPLKRAGRHFKANCPFHKEKTPSFMVNTDKQIFHCFGCGAGGNIFSFLMQHDRLTFPEAVSQIAQHVGVQVPERGSGPSNDEHERLVVLMEKVCQYFERRLLSPQGKGARAYLQGRGVSESTRKTFRIGLAPAGWSLLLDAANTTGVLPQQLEEAGLVIQGQSGHYDRFRNRLIFPVMDARTRIIGFGGRALDGKEPKYLNSPETLLYRKGHHLFGLAQAKDAIVNAKTAVIVEGYFDCVVLADAGLTHVVSPLGTALTEEQARLLRRYAEHVILAFDPDAAGEQATLRGIDLLVAAGLHVRVAQLPTGNDPDECLRTVGRERFQALLDQSLGIFEVLVQSALKRYPGRQTEEKVMAAQFVLPTIANMPNAMLRSEYVRQLADRLHLDEHAVLEELAKVPPRSVVVSRVPVSRQSMPRAVARGPERLLTALILDEPARWAQAQGLVSLDDITDETLRAILAVVCELASANHPATPAQVISRLSEEGQGELVTALVELAQSVLVKDEAFDDCVTRLQRSRRNRTLAYLRDQLRTAEEAGQEQDVRRLLSDYQHVLAQPQGG